MYLVIEIRRTLDYAIFQKKNVLNKKTLIYNIVPEKFHYLTEFYEVFPLHKVTHLEYVLTVRSRG